MHLEHPDDFSSIDSTQFLTPEKKGSINESQLKQLPNSEPVGKEDPEQSDESYTIEDFTVPKNQSFDSLEDYKPILVEKCTRLPDREYDTFSERMRFFNLRYEQMLREKNKLSTRLATDRLRGEVFNRLRDLLATMIENIIPYFERQGIDVDNLEPTHKFIKWHNDSRNKFLNLSQFGIFNERQTAILQEHFDLIQVKIDPSKKIEKKAVKGT